jgi:hypothetical protein
VVDGVAAATALTKDLPVFEPGDDMFDAGTNAAVVSPVVVDAAGFVAARRGDRWDAAVAPVAGGLVAAGEVRLVRRWISTRSTLTANGSAQGRPAAGGLWCRARA